MVGSVSDARKRQRHYERRASDAVLLRVLTPERVMFDAPVQWVQVPLEDGMLGVWPATRH